MKEYRSRWNHYILPVRIGRVIQRITFKGFSNGRESYFRTTDKAVQKALESSKLYGSEFYLYKDESQPEPEVEKEPEMEKDVVEDVENINQAREYLRSIGIDHRRLNTPNAIMKQAQENNIEFPNLQTE